MSITSSKLHRKNIYCEKSRLIWKKTKWVKKFFNSCEVPDLTNFFQIALPKFFYWFSKDFGLETSDKDAIVKALEVLLPDQLRLDLAKVEKSKISLSYSDYNWKPFFRVDKYVNIIIKYYLAITDLFSIVEPNTNESNWCTLRFKSAKNLKSTLNLDIFNWIFKRQFIRSCGTCQNRIGVQNFWMLWKSFYSLRNRNICCVLTSYWHISFFRVSRVPVFGMTFAQLAVRFPNTKLPPFFTKCLEHIERKGNGVTK